MGIFVACTCHYMFRAALDKHITKLMDGSYHNRYRQVCFGGAVVFLVLFLFETIMYMSVLADFDVPRRWLYQI